MIINGETRLVAVLGHPVKHTASPAMHNAAIDVLGLNWRYVALDVDPRHLGAAVRGLAAAGFVGLNLTVPHKMLALHCVDELDPAAQMLGAANTLQFSFVNGLPFIKGFNTDGYGILTALKEDFQFTPKGKTIAIVGCGGAGRAAAIQLAMAGARRLILINRTRAKALAIIRHIRQLRKKQGRRTSRSPFHFHPKLECILEPQACDLIIQATSLGLRPGDPLPIDQSLLRQLAAPRFLDMIYRPADTPAMGLARRCGCRTANGLGMLLHQGARALAIWTGRKIPVETMRKALHKEVYGRKSS
ncbi:MAG: shikimate dehydrogenase [Verrucomicrobiae bacterium]|nr:shikimate dehydrogenase [Verrucomicrobiae bacterium]